MPQKVGNIFRQLIVRPHNAPSLLLFLLRWQRIKHQLAEFSLIRNELNIIEKKKAQHAVIWGRRTQCQLFVVLGGWWGSTGAARLKLKNAPAYHRKEKIERVAKWQVLPPVAYTHPHSHTPIHHTCRNIPP